MPEPQGTASPPRERLSDRHFVTLALLLVFLAYFTVFLAVGHGLLQSAVSSLRNLIALGVLTAAVLPFLRRYIAKMRLLPALALHLVLACAFSLFWYWLLMVLIGVSNGDSFTEFTVRAFFPGSAMAWQFLQGLAVYALIAALVQVRADPGLPSFVVADGETAAGGRAPGLGRYFIRRGDEIHPVDVGRIVTITGADDYAEVGTLDGSHLVRMTLADFEAALDGGSFIRVHRSRIINVDRLVRAEPAGGGRLLLHMENGEVVQASRAGTKLLRDRVI
ncbi:MAG TPA: LytTR family DNA-binding domain-containing protein [Allosphingosinicella sp.]|jgi:hypothetical protein